MDILPMDSTTHNGHSTPAEAPPHNPDAEVGLLGSLLFLNDAIDKVDFQPEYFYRSENQIVAETIITMWKSGCRALDHITIGDELQRAGRLESAGGVPYLFTLAESVPHAEHVRYYANIVREHWQRRELIRRCELLSKEARLPDSNIGHLIEHTAEMLTHSQLSRGRNRVVDFGFIDSAVFAAKKYESNWLADYVLKANQPAIIAGPSKAMKTGFLVELFISLATGLKLFDSVNVKKCRVALMSAESGEETLQETAIRICASKGIGDFGSLKSQLFWAFRPPQISEASHIASLHSFIVDNQIEVLGIDPAYLSMGIGDDASNAFKFGDVLMNLTRLAADTGITPILAAHTNKNCPPGVELELSNIAYSAFPQWARQWFLLNRRESYDKSTPGSHKLFISYGGSAGHSGSWAVDIEEGDIKFGRRWECDVRPASEIRDDKRQRDNAAKAVEREAEVADMRQRILDAADMVPKTSATLASLVSATRNNGAFMAALSGLVADGEIQLTEQPRKNAEPIRRYCTS